MKLEIGKMRKITSKENKRTNIIIIVCVLCAITMFACVLVACANVRCSKHDWVIVEDETIQATCTSNGQITQMCANCRVKKTNAVAKLGHDYGAWTSNDDLTHSRVCKNNPNHVETENHTGIVVNGDCILCCDESIPNPNNCNHDWSDWNYNGENGHFRTCRNCLFSMETEDCSIIDADCENPSICEVCGHRYEGALGHDWSDWTKISDGYHSRVCQNDSTHSQTEEHKDEDADNLCDDCGCVYIDTELPTDPVHIWTEWTSNEDGTHTRTCVSCIESHDETDDCAGGEADCYNGALCDLCGFEYTDALGHDWNEWESNEDGTHGRTCKNSEDCYDEDDCNYVEIDRTPADCENAEIITYQCDGCGHTKTEEGEGALGHDWSAWNSNEDDTHTRVCANDEKHNETVDCNYVVIEDVKVDCEVDGYTVYQCDGCAHSYRVDGEKALGHDYGEWVLDTAGNRTQYCANNGNHKIVEKYIPNTSIDITQGLILVHYVQSALIEDPSNVRLEFVKPVFDKETGETINETTVVTKFTYYTTSTAKLMRFTFDDISATEMGTVVSANLYIGDELVAVKEYSVKEYAMKYLHATSTSDAMKEQNKELRAMLVDMLNYGAAAQIYFNYKTNDLVNADLTEEMRASGTQENPEISADDDVYRNPDGLITLNGKSVSAMSIIQLHLSFTLNGIDANDIEIVMDYTDLSGDARRYVIDGADAIAYQYEDGVRYSVVFDKYGASQLRKDITISFRNKATGETIGDSGTTSIESNLRGLLEDRGDDEALVNLIYAMMKYSDSAAAYFDR